MSILPTVSQPAQASDVIKDSANIVWATLSAEQKTALLVEFGNYLDQLPPTCSMQAKQAHLRDWLNRRGISYSYED